MTEKDDLPQHCTADLEGVALEFLEQSGVPGLSVGIVHDGQLAWTLGAGVTSFDGGSTPDSQVVYQIASITKTFTATAVLQLRDDGLLALDDPLERHLPEFGAAHSAFGPLELVTIRHLLQHTSGLQGEVVNHDLRQWTVLPMSDVLASLDQVTVAATPGTRVKYSNLGYRLLSEVVHRLSGRPYWDYLRCEILEPLEMRDTSPVPATDSAQGHQARAFGDRPRPASGLGPDVQVGAGGLWSSVRDLARWLVAHQLRADSSLERGHGQALRSATLQEMQRPTFVEDEAWTSARGLGWGVVRDGDAMLVGHGGHVGGFTSDIRFCSTDRVGAIVLTNGIGTVGPWEITPKLIDVVRRYRRASRAREASSARVAVPAPPAWRELLGDYRAPGGWLTARIEVRDGELVFIAERHGTPIRLERTPDPLCFIALDDRPAGETVRFFRGPDGTLEGVNLAGFPLAHLRPAFEGPLWSS